MDALQQALEPDAFEWWMSALDVAICVGAYAVAVWMFLFRNSCPTGEED